MKNYILFIFIATILVGCTSKQEVVDFDAVFDEMTMITNHEQNNLIEGTPFVIQEFSQSKITCELPKGFNPLKKSEKWYCGWGNDEAFYEGGCENIAENIAISKNEITIGNQKRGRKPPKKGQKIVFWRFITSNFNQFTKKPIINPKLWPEFSGESVSFGGVAFSENDKRWYMVLNECDTSKMQTYLASSIDLIHWTQENNGKPILTSTDFKNCNWAGFDGYGNKQSAMVSDLHLHNGKWILIMDGYNKAGQRSIGYGTCSSFTEKIQIAANPILSPGKMGSWYDRSVFYGKIEKINDEFILFFDGSNQKRFEKVGIIRTKNIYDWSTSVPTIVIDNHTGWRSSPYTSEPNMIEKRGDSILLYVAGSKALNNSPYARITNSMNKSVSGNVDDAQIGCYLSVDNCKSFKPHKNNPVFVNNYLNPYENEHMGGNFSLIKTDTSHFIIYQAKSSKGVLRYNIMIREKKLMH